MDRSESFSLDVPAEAPQRFFRRIDWLAFWTATVIALAVYVYSLPPTVTLEDCGELAVAGNSLGVPHPPGYPIWSILAWIFTRVFSFVTFRGQPNPSWSIGLLSAVFGALAAGITAMLICRSGADLLRQSRDELHKADPATEDHMAWAGGVVASLLFAFSPVMWSQSVIVEVYSLNAFFLVFVFLLTYRWMSRPKDSVLYLTAFVFGLGLTNYQVLLLAALPLVAAVLLRDIKLFGSFAVVGVPFGVTILLINKGLLPPLVHPSHWTCYFYFGLNFLLLALACFLLPRGKTVALTILCAELGVAFYMYMPIVSDLRNPPMNWGYPRTWEGFKHALRRGQYEQIKPTNIFSDRFVTQLGDYLTDLRGQFTLPLAVLGFLPFCVWTVRVGKKRLTGLYPAIILSAAATALVAVEKLFAGGADLSLFYKWPIAGVILILLAGGVVLVVGQLQEVFHRLIGKTKASPYERVLSALVLLGVAAVFIFYVASLLGKVVGVTAPLREAGQTLTTEETGARIQQALGIVLLIVVPVVIVIATLYLMIRHELKLSIGHSSQQWVIATLLGFLVMSVVLIVLANPKGDIQDNFIQRVKFISSHALYAFWIGYGLIFGLAWLDTLCHGDRGLRCGALALACLLPLMPLLQNGFNRELIRLVGGGEQTGHDFGWQFGNYQLRGAQAISEELDPEEEPLPNPSFPPEMGKDAVFYGGTDPGRFVPTYMIYAARVREDVYLITQNALADNTYMSVMRDLYGDQIWIPAQPESAHAFRIYVEEVQSGKRPKNAQLTIQDGRVQVSGALGVMEINGILARMIFDHNKYRHAFYVEESYVIPWMYPFLTPHGLIMKINRDHAPLSRAVVNNDQDFWDWYTRRLAGDLRFTRDIVARKSFSKLRSAIAGLYANRGMLRDAERAFKQARILYVLSPEANMRLVHEVLMRESRFPEASELIRDFGERDPGNQQVPGLLKRIDDIRSIMTQTQELEAKHREGRIDIDSALKLAGLYLSGNQPGRFSAMINSILANTNLPLPYVYQAAKLLQQGQRHGELSKALDLFLARAPADTPAQVFLDISRMYVQARQPQGILRSLHEYLKRQPRDWRAWLDVASIHLQLNQTLEATQALDRAARIGGTEALNIINQDERFQKIRKRPLPPGIMGLPQGSPAHPRMP